MKITITNLIVTLTFALGLGCGYLIHVGHFAYAIIVEVVGLLSLQGWANTHDERVRR